LALRILNAPSLEGPDEPLTGANQEDALHQLTFILLKTKCLLYPVTAVGRDAALLKGKSQNRLQ